jgi:hypothetical protein
MNACRGSFGRGKRFGFLRIYVCMYVLCVCIVYVFSELGSFGGGVIGVSVYVCMYVCMYCVYVCMLYMYAHIPTKHDTHMHIQEIHTC